MASSDEPLIKVEGVSKKFCRSLRKSLWYGVKDMGREVLGMEGRHGLLRPEEFWAVNDVSFAVRRGECVGLIGRNGAGKTTLLKMLNGLIKPDRGRIEMRGRVGALIALGAGFNPILSGRENIYVNASVLGLTRRETDERLGDIIDFAEIGEFIDAPVQSYSSGMQVRLGFAVAATISPDVLLVDEVLAVGDTRFRVRCYNRIRELLPKTAVILVSHSMYDIARACTSVVLLDAGRVRHAGPTGEGINAYHCVNDESPAGGKAVVAHLDACITSITAPRFSLTTDGLESTVDGLLEVVCPAAVGPCRLRVIFHDAGMGGAVAEWDSAAHDVGVELRQGTNRIPVAIPGIRLRSGSYRVVIVLSDPDKKGYHAIVEDGIRVTVENGARDGAYYLI